MVLLTAASLPALADPAQNPPAKDAKAAPTAITAAPAKSGAKPESGAGATPASSNSAPPAAAKASQTADASPQVAAAAKTPEKKKQLHTVPEDGSNAEDIWTPNKWVREILEKRPNEDLVICIAGCFSTRDKVVYARLIEHGLPAAPAVAETPPIAEPGAPAEVKPTSVAPEPEAKSTPASPAIINAKPAEGDTNAPNLPAGKSELVPAIAAPEGAASSEAKLSEPTAATDKAAEDKPQAAPESEDAPPTASSDNAVPGENSEPPAEAAPGESSPDGEGSSSNEPQPDSPPPDER